MVKNKILFKKSQGFTLLEILVAMSIVGILITMAYPMFKTSMVNNRLYSEASQTTNIITLARSEAIKRNDYVTICPTNDGTTCLIGNDFQTGTIIFLNSAQTGLSTTDQIIKVFNKWTQIDKGKLANGNFITFSADGRSNITNSILVCKATYPSFSIALHASGRIKMSSNTGDGGC